MAPNRSVNVRWYAQSWTRQDQFFNFSTTLYEAQLGVVLNRYFAVPFQPIYPKVQLTDTSDILRYDLSNGPVTSGSYVRFRAVDRTVDSGSLWGSGGEGWCDYGDGAMISHPEHKYGWSLCIRGAAAMDGRKTCQFANLIITVLEICMEFFESQPVLSEQSLELRIRFWDNDIRYLQTTRLYTVLWSNCVSRVERRVASRIDAICCCSHGSDKLVDIN